MKQTHPLAGAIRKEKGIKGIQEAKEEVKVLLFADDETPCIRGSQNSARKVL